VEFWVGSWLGGGESLLGRERVALCIPLFCVFFLSVSLLLLFASFAVLLNCPYPDPRVLPFSSHSPLHPSGRMVTERLRGPLLLAGAKPRRKTSNGTWKILCLKSWWGAEFRKHILEQFEITVTP